MFTRDRLSDRFNCEKDLQNLIYGKVQESRTLDYKGPEDLDNHGEIAKDVSSFANSAGGIIIYGIVEDRNHYPHMIEWIDRRKKKGDPYLIATDNWAIFLDNCGYSSNVNPFESTFLFQDRLLRMLMK